MRKITFILLMILGVSSVFGQAKSELNFGIIGVSYDIPVATNIAIAPTVGTNFDISWLTLGVKADYYFDSLFGLPDAWDVYGGLNAGYALWINQSKNGANDFNIGIQIGGRWFWSEKWGLYLELGGGHTSGGTAGLGITMRM